MEYENGTASVFQDLGVLFYMGKKCLPSASTFVVNNSLNMTIIDFSLFVPKINEVKHFFYSYIFTVFIKSLAFLDLEFHSLFIRQKQIADI